MTGGAYIPTNDVGTYAPPEATPGAHEGRPYKVRMNINFPFQFDGRGRTQQATLQDYINQIVEQVLFTSPGERVNLPDFGSGLLQLPFAPNSMEMAAATQFSVQAALQKWLGSYVKVQSVVASVEEAVLTVQVTYTPLSTDVTQVQTFVYGTTA